MRSWTRRERGLGAGIVLMAVAAIAVPAWAADGDEATVEPASDAASEGDVVMVAGDGDPQGFLAAPSAEERRKIDQCMTERGFGPGTQVQDTDRLPAPDNGGDVVRAPAPSPEFMRAAEECGLPKPPAVFAAVAEAVEGRAGELCPPPPPPPARR